MASTPPGAKKQKLDYIVDKAIFDNFMRTCSHKGFAPQVVVEKMMAKFSQSGQI